MAVSQPRHAVLLERLRTGVAGGDEIAEFHVIDAEHHAFDAMCRRHAPFSPIALGYAWGEELAHAGAPEARLIVRHGARVEFEGVETTIEDATRMLAVRGHRMSHAGWRGGAGQLGDLAGLMHPASGVRGDDGMEAEQPSVSPVMEPTPLAADPTPNPTPTPAVGTNYDLFG